MPEHLRVSHRGAELYVELEGAGSDVLLLHGGFGHMGTLAGLRELLVARYRVLLMDSRGMGRSSLGEGPLSYHQQELDALRVLDELAVESCAVVGFSDGGITGLRMAARDDGRVRALAVIGSRWRAEDSRHLWDAFPTIDRAVLSAGPDAALVDDYERLNPDGDFDRLARAYSQMWRDAGAAGHPGDRVAKIVAPVLVAVGDRDPILPISACVELHATLATSQLLVLPAAGHSAHIDRADLYHPALEAFLAGSLATSRR